VLLEQQTLVVEVVAVEAQVLLEIILVELVVQEL